MKRRLMLCKKYWQLYLFLFLPIIYLLVFKYYPMLGAQIAFRHFRAADGIWGSEWIGLDNFIRFFSSYQFSRVLSNTLKLSLYLLAASFPFPIVFALFLNTMEGKHCKKVVQTVTYMPYFISMVVLVSIITQIFNPNVGLYATIWRSLTGSTPPDILGRADLFAHVYVWSDIWQSTGWNSVIYIAALSSVSPDLHEAGQLDGMTRFQRILHIDLPAILPTITIVLILNAGKIMNLGFEKIYLMQNDLNLSASEVISTYVYKVGLTAGGGDFSYATAIGLFNSVVNLVLIVVVNQICKRLGESSLW